MSHHLNIMGRQSVGKFDHSFISSSQMGKLKRITQLMHKLLISSTLLLLLMWTWDLSKPNFPIFFPCSDLRIDCIYHSNNLPLSFSNSYNLQKAGAGCDKNHWNPPNRFFFFKANPFRCSLTLKIISHRERLKMLSFFFSSPLSRLVQWEIPQPPAGIMTFHVLSTQYTDQPRELGALLHHLLLSFQVHPQMTL